MDSHLWLNSPYKMSIYKCLSWQERNAGSKTQTTNTGEQVRGLYLTKGGKHQQEELTGLRPKQNPQMANGKHKVVQRQV